MQIWRRCRESMIFLLKKCRIRWGLTSPKFWRSNLMKIGRGENRVLIDIPVISIFSTPLYAKMFNSTLRCRFPASRQVAELDSFSWGELHYLLEKASDC